MVISVGEVERSETQKVMSWAGPRFIAFKPWTRNSSLRSEAAGVVVAMATVDVVIVVMAAAEVVVAATGVVEGAFEVVEGALGVVESCGRAVAATAPARRVKKDFISKS